MATGKSEHERITILETQMVEITGKLSGVSHVIPEMSPYLVNNYYFGGQPITTAGISLVSSRLRDILKGQDEELRQETFAKDDDDDWEVVEHGGEPRGWRTHSPNPSQCECGREWMVDTQETIFNNKPNAGDVANCYNAINFPNNPQSCDAPCLPVKEAEKQWYLIQKNKNTGKFRLFCSKRRQWHCERVT